MFLKTYLIVFWLFAAFYCFVKESQRHEEVIVVRRVFTVTYYFDSIMLEKL